jgi:autotransporter-associated beta strand protein
MNEQRVYPAYQLLPDGRVLVAGGYSNQYANPLNSVEIYDPIANTWSLLTDTLSSNTYLNSSSVLDDGRILISGGYNTSTTVTNICSTYNPTQTLALTKSGAGKWILGGSTLSYSGTTVLEAGTLDLGGTLRVLPGGVTMSGGTLVNGLNKHVEGNITVTSGTNLITAGILGTSTLNVTGGTVTLDYPVNNTYTGGTTVSAGATLKAVTSVDPSTSSDLGAVLGLGNVTVSGTLKTGSGSAQRGQLRYGGTLTFNGGSKIYLGGA